MPIWYVVVFILGTLWIVVGLLGYLMNRGEYAPSKKLILLGYAKRTIKLNCTRDPVFGHLSVRRSIREILAITAWMLAGIFGFVSARRRRKSLWKSIEEGRSEITKPRKMEKHGGKWNHDDEMDQLGYW